MPAGAEALVHTREAIEGTIRANPDLCIWVVTMLTFRTPSNRCFMGLSFLLWKQECPHYVHGPSSAKTAVEYLFCRVADTKLEEMLNKVTHWRLYSAAL